MGPLRSPHLLGGEFHHSWDSIPGPCTERRRGSPRLLRLAAGARALARQYPPRSAALRAAARSARPRHAAAAARRPSGAPWIQRGMETPLDVLSRAASLVHADDEKREAALRGEPRMQSLPVSSVLTNHRTGPPPISPNKRKLSMDQGDDELDCENDHVSKMSRMFNPHLNKTANGDFRKEHRERSRSPIERAAAPTMSLHANHMYASIPSLTMDQPLALTKNSMDATRTVGITPTLTSVERQQNRPSVITCASANNRNCNLSHCPIAHSGCASAVPAYRRPASTTTACDPVVEEHFRRSLGKNYKEPEPVANSVSITGSVDDHFAKALGDTWLQIKAAKDGVSSSPESASRRGQSSPSSHMVNHNHSPSVVS